MAIGSQPQQGIGALADEKPGEPPCQSGAHRQGTDGEKGKIKARSSGQSTGVSNTGKAHATRPGASVCQGFEIGAGWIRRAQARQALCLAQAFGAVGPRMFQANGLRRRTG